MPMDETLAVAAVSDRDRVYVVDVPMRSVRYDIPLAPKTEPGRVALDATGHAYVAEPAVLCVEMNNENTALPFWAGNLDDLPEPYAGDLRTQWNAWLRS